jgi:hemolysin activation/secretion protein
MLSLFIAPLSRVWRLSLAGLALLFVAAAAHAQAAPPDAPVPRFAILEFIVNGNTVLTADVIERAVYPFLGDGRSIDDVEAARSALERAYRDRGYGTVGVDIPEQRADSGVIELLVLEGRVSRLRVNGARYYSQGYILEKVPSSAEGSVPQFGQLQAELGVVNRSADRRVSPVLRPGRTPGTTEVDLQVEDRLPLHGSLELNNHASPNTSQTRLLGSLRYDNLWQRDHSLSLQVQASPEKTDEVRIFSTTYALPTGAVNQNTLNLSYLYSDSTVATGVGSTTVFGKGSIYGLRQNLILDLSETRYHALTLGLDYKDMRETIEVAPGSGIPTPIRYLPLTASYTGSEGDEKGGRWQFGAGLVAGLRGLVNRDQQFADKRYRASGSFAVLKLDVGREQKLPGNLDLASRLQLHLSGRPLISNEQFVSGGADSVRGYLESAAAGDQGLRSSLEVRTANLAAPQAQWFTNVKAHVFFEGAALELIDPLLGQTWRFRLLGAGMGLRVKAQPGGSLSLDLAWPLLKLGNSERGKLRLHASGNFEF